MVNSFIFSSLSAIIAGFIAIMYKSIAMRCGWPIKIYYLNHEKLFRVVAWSFIIGGTIEIITQLSWAYGLLMMVGSFLFSCLYTYVFKENIEWILSLLTVATVIFWLLGGIEFLEYRLENIHPGITSLKDNEELRCMSIK